MKKLQEEFKAKAGLIRDIVNQNPSIKIAYLIEKVRMDCCISTMTNWLKVNSISIRRERKKIYESKKRNLLNKMSGEILKFMNEQGHKVTAYDIKKHFKLRICLRTLYIWIHTNIKVNYELKELRLCSFCGSELLDHISDWYCENCGKTLINKK